MEESQRHLAKFLEQHPNHPAAALAVASAGELLGKQAQQLIESAKADEKDPKRQETQLADARTQLHKAAEKFKEAEDEAPVAAHRRAAARQYARTQGPTLEVAGARAALESRVDDIELKRGLVDYYLAQTYAEPNHEDRKAALERAAATFDGIYQRERAADNLPATGVLSHMWHGRVAEETGDLDLAKDIYEEVLAQAPQRTANLRKLGFAVCPGRLLPLADRRQAGSGEVSLRGRRLAAGVPAVETDGRIPGRGTGAGQGQVPPRPRTPPGRPRWPVSPRPGSSWPTWRASAAPTSASAGAAAKI